MRDLSLMDFTGHKRIKFINIHDSSIISMEGGQLNTLGLNQVNYALVEKTRPMMYKAMKYWGKKPNNIFREYINNYSRPNEIVLDAFAGSGVCPLEAIQIGRKAILKHL